jgi:hypothetical protein
VWRCGGADLREPGYDVRAEVAHEPDGVCGRVAERQDVHLVDAGGGQLAHPLEEPGGVLCRVERVRQHDRATDPVVVRAEVGAVAAQHVELVPDVLGHGLASDDQVAGIAVRRHQAQGLLLAVAADHHGDPVERLRGAHGLGKLVVRAVEATVVVAPHLPDDAQCLLESLEPLLEGREGDAVGEVLELVPRRADAEGRSAAGEHVQGGDDLGEQSGVPVGDAGHQQLQLDAARVRCQEAQGGVALEHRFLCAAEHPQLEVVVHQREVVDSGLLDRGPEGGQHRGDAGRAVGGAEAHLVHAEPHRAPSVTPVSSALTSQSLRARSRS